MSQDRSDQLGVTTFHTLAFSTRKAAEKAYEDFVNLGVSPDDISLFVHAEPPEDRNAAVDRGIDLGGAAGAGASALAGGAGGLLAGLGLLVIPGLGALLAVGPVAAALTGVITGALGGFAGSLIGAGVCETAALATEKQLAAGHAIIASLTTSGTSESPRRLTVRQTWSASTTVRFLLAGLVLLGACSARDRAGAAATQPGKAADLAIAAPQTQARGRLDVASSAFAPGAAIPGDYGAYGGKRSPPVRWSGGPAQAKSYVLIIEDPDAPTPRPFVHWVIYDIPAGAAVPDSAAPPGAREGRSTMMTQGYFPLAPPPGPAHHYHFQVFALDADLDLKPGASRDEVVKAMAGHVLARGDLVGLYRKP